MQTISGLLVRVSRARRKPRPRVGRGKGAAATRLHGVRWAPGEHQAPDRDGPTSYDIVVFDPKGRIPLTSFVQARALGPDRSSAPRPSGWAAAARRAASSA